MLTITRKLEFDAGHRLTNHESKCRHTHGHRYTAFVTVRAEKLDEVGRVIDFGEVKRILGTWIDDNWDHAYIHDDNDPIADLNREMNLRSYALGKPPTAENMSRYLFEKAVELLEPHGIEVVSMRLYETPNCYADYNGPPA